MVMGRPDFLPAPHINEAVKKAVDDGQVHYTSNYGLLELRQEVARKLKGENGSTTPRKPKSSSRRASPKRCT